MLGINNKYIENVKQTLQLLDKYDIRVAIHSILTQRNSTKEDFISIFHFFNRLPTNLLEPDIGGESIYVNSAIQGTIAPTKEAQASISALCKKLQNKANFPILSSGLDKEDTNSSTKTWAKFNERSVCSGNYLQLFVLPDGNVTICEELYWHPKFIVGNILEQSLNDIWNSEAALIFICSHNFIFPMQVPVSDLEQTMKLPDFLNKYVIEIL